MSQRRLGVQRTPKVRTLKPIKELTLEDWYLRWCPDLNETAREQLNEVINRERYI